MKKKGKKITSCLILLLVFLCMTIYSMRSSRKINEESIVYEINNDKINSVVDVYDKTVINVKDMGANGDDEEDDTVAFQKALDLGKEWDSIKVMIPEGKYYINFLQYYPNTTIVLDESAWLYFRSGPLLTNVAFIEDIPAYSYGFLHVIGGHIIGQCEDSNTQQICIQAGKLSELLIDSVEFKSACYRNHLLDISGCRNVTISNTQFGGIGLPENVRPSTPNGDEIHNAKMEMIQIDLAKGLGVGRDNEYSEIPSSNIVIENCLFSAENEPNDYILYRPIGIHNNSQEELYYSNVIVRNNKFVNCFGRAIGIAKTQNIIIEDNTFINCNDLIDGIIVLCLKDSDGNEGDISNVIVKNNFAESLVNTKNYPFLYVEEYAGNRKVYNMFFMNNQTMQISKFNHCINLYTDIDIGDVK